MTSCGVNKFTTDYYKMFLTSAIEAGYRFCTISEFIDLEYPDKNHFIVRHDVDKDPTSLKKKIRIELDLGIRSTNFIRVAGSDYNFLSYPTFNILNTMFQNKFEIGLHTGFLEFSRINRLDPMNVLKHEFEALSNFFDIRGVSTHRDINYCHNSLPYLEENWDTIKKIGFKYQAYDKKIMETCVYVNEGLNPHLCWRSQSPEDVIKTGKSICMLTHNHWWFDVHPFE